MKPKYLTKDLLVRWDASKTAIDWFIDVGMEGFPLDRLDEIEGDFADYIGDLKETFHNSTFDDDGNIIEYKDDGFSWTATYDKDGNQLTYDDSEGESWTATYDENGNQLTHEYSDGYSWEATYDEKGNQLTYKHADGYSCESTFDNEGHMVMFKNSDGEYTTSVSYKSAGSKYIHYFDENDEVSLNVYDEEGNLVYHRTEDYWEKYSYDRGREVYHENSSGVWSESTYDDEGRLRTYRDPFDELTYVIDYDEACIAKLDDEVILYIPMAWKWLKPYLPDII